MHTQPVILAYKFTRDMPDLVSLVSLKDEICRAAYHRNFCVYKFCDLHLPMSQTLFLCLRILSGHPVRCYRRIPQLMPGLVCRPQEHLIMGKAGFLNACPAFRNIFHRLEFHWKRCFLQGDLLREPASLYVRKSP